MERRILEITVMSASNLERVVSKMRVHARVSLGGAVAEKAEKRTPPDKHGRTNPVWNHTVRFDLSQEMIENCNTFLVVKLYCSRIFGDRYVGEFNTSIKELFDYAGASGNGAVLNFAVQKGCANSYGTVRFGYKFGEKFVPEKLFLTGA